MTASRAPLPRLGVVYGPKLPPAMELAEAAEGLCRLVWIRTGARTDDRIESRILARLGEVIAPERSDPGAVAEALGPVGLSGICALDETVLLATAEIAAEIGVTFHSPEVAVRLVDKAAQKAALVGAGVVTGSFRVVPVGGGSKRLADAVDGLRFPLVAKPRVGSSSRNASVVTNWSELVELFSGGDAPREDFLLEEQLAEISSTDPDLGSRLSVDTMLRAGSSEHLVVAGKFRLAEPFRYTGSFIPARLEGTDEEEVYRLVDQAVAAIGVRDGVVHANLVKTPTGMALVSLNDGIGGGGLGELFAEQNGIPLRRLAVLAALGDPSPTEIIEASRPRGIAYHLFLQPPIEARGVVAIDGAEEVLGLPGVRYVHLNRAPGEPVDWRRGSQEYIVSIRGTAKDMAELRRTKQRIESCLRLSYG